LAELGRAAARLAGIPDDVVITVEILPDREYEWCSLQDDYVEIIKERMNSINRDEFKTISSK
jgi:hypothetical protein